MTRQNKKVKGVLMERERRKNVWKLSGRAHSRVGSNIQKSEEIVRIKITETL